MNFNLGCPCPRQSDPDLLSSLFPSFVTDFIILGHFDVAHYDPTMTSANFAAAQKRVLERRRRLEAEARARVAEQQRASRIDPAALERLPYPLNRLSGSGLQLWDRIKGREGTRPSFRVSQVDAELLDEELLDLLKGQVGEALKYFGVRPLQTDVWNSD